MSIIYKNIINNNKKTIFDTSNIANNIVTFRENINIIPETATQYALNINGDLNFNGNIYQNNVQFVSGGGSGTGTGPTGPTGPQPLGFSFDGGTPFTNYQMGPGLNCGGVL